MSTQPESRLSQQIMTALRVRGAFVFKVHGGPTMMIGLPDIVGTYKGRSIWLETKVPGGKKPTERQEYIHGQIRKAGGRIVVVRSVEEALSFLTHIDRSMSKK